MRGGSVLALREPIGECVAITPWNFRAAMFTCKARAAGYPVAAKSVAQSPLTAPAFTTLHDEHGCREPRGQPEQEKDSARGLEKCHGPGRQRGAGTPSWCCGNAAKQKHDRNETYSTSTRRKSTLPGFRLGPPTDGRCYRGLRSPVPGRAGPAARAR
ncbi:aldehyde dehydrogenase family protein [Streptomyces sp. NPDC001076]